MNHSACTQLDDYLADVLSGAEMVAFAAHLDDCPACRQEVDQQREIVRLLSRGLEAADPVPPLLAERTERAMRLGDRRRRTRLVGGLAAAAVILIGVGIALRTEPLPQQDVVDTEVIVAAPAEPEPSAKSLVRISLLNPDEAILVPIETKSPNVSIVWIYPTVKVASADTTSPIETMSPTEILPTEPIISE